jgi:hypothetical protein
MTAGTEPQRPAVADGAGPAGQRGRPAETVA